MLRVILVACALLVAFTSARESDYAELGEGEQTDDDDRGNSIVYRVSWATQSDSDPSKTGSRGTFQIKFGGYVADGRKSHTGFMTFVSHPGYQCGALSDPECLPGIDGKPKNPSGAEDPAACKCSPFNRRGAAVDGYNEDDAKWSPISGKVQHATVKSKDVGEVFKVQIQQIDDATTVDDTWTPAWLKVNTNDMQTGLGNGVYYLDIGKTIGQKTTDGMYEALTDQVDSDGNKVTMESFASHKYGIIKCEASSCEEEMDRKFMITTV